MVDTAGTINKRKLRLSLILTAWAFSLLLFQSLPTHAEQKTAPQKEIDNAQNFPRSALIPPVAKSELTSQPQKTPTQNKPQQAKSGLPWWEKAFGPETWSSWALLAVAFIAACVGLLTLNAMKRQALANEIAAKAAGDSADAARKSAEVAEQALKLTERAYLTAEPLRLKDWKPEGKGATVIYSLTNGGRTPATLTEVRGIGKLSENIPSLPDYTKIPSTYHGKTRIHPNETIEWPIDVSFIRTAERKAMQRQSQLLFIYGRIVYEDIFRNPHHVLFFTRYDLEREEFFLVNEPGYNYSD